MPVFFIPHGAGPCFFMDWSPAHTWDRMADFLKGIAATLPARPKAIVLISGHWLEADFSVTGHARPPLTMRLSVSLALQCEVKRAFFRRRRRCRRIGGGEASADRPEFFKSAHKVIPDKEHAMIIDLTGKISIVTGAALRVEGGIVESIA